MDRTRRLHLMAGVVCFGLCWIAFGKLFQSFPRLYDTDSYFHLAVARLYAHFGSVDVMPWARFSALHDGFGDKEFLFHWILAPFAAGEDPALGGRWALAFWNALAVVVLGSLGVRAAGRWGLLVPCLLWLGSLDFAGRMVRLRPETPALLLLLLAAYCFGTRRFRWLGVVAFVFTLSYTAFHALLGLVVAFFAWQGWRRRAWHGLGLAYPLLGTGVALLVHPHFPHNLVVWKIQSVDFFRLRHILDVGNEIEAAPTDSLLFFNLGWLAGCLLLVWAALSRPPREPREQESSEAPQPSTRRDDREVADAMTIGALAFGGLLLLGRRFATHALPFLLLALLFQLRAAGRTPGSTLRLPTRHGAWLRLPAWLMVTLLLAGCAWSGGRYLSDLASGTPEPPPELGWHALGRALPPGARVAATWGDTHIYAFFAPHGQYLNVLDPVFMAVSYPKVYEAQARLFDDLEPDVPRVLARDLDSQFLALPKSHPTPSLLERLRFDPRIEPVFEAGTVLFELRPRAARDFVLDWRLVPIGTHLPVPAEEPLEAHAAYPLDDDPILRTLEAYVDARRFEDGSAARCRALVRDETLESDANRRYELAPWGPTTLWLGDRLLVQVRGTMKAVLGRGVEFDVHLEAGTHRWTLLTCQGEPFDGPVSDQVGFYLRQR